MGRVRGSFRHHEPYLLASSLARALESLFDELPAGSSRLVVERLTTLVDGNVLLGSVAAFAIANVATFRWSCSAIQFKSSGLRSDLDVWRIAGSNR